MSKHLSDEIVNGMAVGTVLNRTQRAPLIDETFAVYITIRILFDSVSAHLSPCEWEMNKNLIAH